VGDSEDTQGDGGGIEVADFDDPLLPSGESKRGTADAAAPLPPPTAATLRAVEAALAAAHAANRAYFRKNEELTAEVAALRTKYERAVADVQMQQQQQLQQQQQQQLQHEGAHTQSKRVSGLLEQELELCKQKLQSQETKLKQAAEFVNFQEEQIQNLKDEIQDMREEAAIAGVGGSSGGQLREELEAQKALAQKYATQIEDGASYVQHLQDQLDEATDEAARLRARLRDLEDDEDDDGFAVVGRQGPDGGPSRPTMSALRDELKAQAEKLSKAAAYVQYQEGVINELTAELTLLEQEQKAASAAGSSSSSGSGSGSGSGAQDREEEVTALREQVAELEGRLGQGATYCAFLQSQVDAATAEVEKVRAALTDAQQKATSTEETIRGLQEQLSKGASAPEGDNDAHQQTARQLEHSKRLCAAYQVQMQRGAEYVEELKAELVDAKHRIVRLEKLQAASAQPGNRGGDRLVVLQEELAAAFAELERTRGKLAAGGASQSEVNFYKSQNETYLTKLQQGADYVDSLQAQLQQAEDALARQGGGGDGSGYSGGGRGVSSSAVPADNVVQELIEFKMKFAAAATEVDHERRRRQEGDLKLQAAGKRIAQLEAALARAQEAPAEKPAGFFAFLTGASSSSSSSGARNGPAGSNARPRSSSQTMAMAPESSHGGSIAGSVAGSEAGYRDGRMARISAPLQRYGGVPGRGVPYGPGSSPPYGPGSSPPYGPGGRGPGPGGPYGGPGRGVPTMAGVGPRGPPHPHVMTPPGGGRPMPPRPPPPGAFPGGAYGPPGIAARR
jgi:hypothetical protein